MEQSKKAVPPVYLGKIKMRVDNFWYTILQGMSDSLMAPEAVMDATVRWRGSLSSKPCALFDFQIQTFSCEEELKNESKLIQLNSTFNQDGDDKDVLDRDDGVEQYSWMKNCWWAAWQSVGEQYLQ